MFIHFTQADLKLLKHLRIVFDNTNEVFIAGKYDQYMPVGLLVVHTVTLCHRYNQNRFEEKDQALYHQLLNAEYLKMARVLFYLIRHEKLTLLNQRDETPVRHKELKKVVAGFINHERDDYLNVFARLIAFDEYIETFKNTRGVSTRDPKIIAAIHIQADIMDQRRLLKTDLNANHILYNPVRHYEPASTDVMADPAIQRAREDALMEALADWDLTVPADMRETDCDSPQLLWNQLNKTFPDLFPEHESEDQMIEVFFNQQKLSAFTDEQLHWLSILRSK